MASEDSKLANAEVSHHQDNGVAKEDVKENGVARYGVKENGNVNEDVKENGIAKDGINDHRFATEKAIETANGVAKDGVNENRFATENGIETAGGVAKDGVEENGVANEDVKENGVAKDGIKENGFATEIAIETASGVAKDGGKENGIANEDVKENGVAKDGVKESGFATENAIETASGVAKDGVKENGIATEKGIEIAGGVATEEDVYKVHDTEDNGGVNGLNEHEKKALAELRSKLEEAILTKNLFKKHKEIKEAAQNSKSNEQELKTSVEEQDMEIDENIKLWGVPLMPSKGDEGTDIILLKFLNARDFKADDTLEMLRNTLQWRKENKIDSILEEDFGSDYDSVAYMSGVDREGHPVCYNVYGVFGNNEIYNKTFGTEESRERFLRWRLQMMEMEIRKLNFKPGGVSSLLQISDLKDTPGPARKDLRMAMKQAVGLLQDNYPEFVATNIFINVPFWYYAFNALLSPFLTQRTKSKFVFTRPARVTETLIKHITAEEIPVHYGGLKRENDPDFSTNDVVSEIFVKAGSTETIEIPAPEGGSILIWDITVQGWEVKYKEEFIPRDEDSNTILVNKAKRIGWQVESIRNSFRNNEAGKILLTIENGSFKKKRVLYRFKTNKQLITHE